MNIFHFLEDPYNLSIKYTLERKRDHTVYHGSGSLSSIAPKLWNLLPTSIKTSAYLRGALSCLRQFLGTENPLKMIKHAFYFTLKPLSILRIFKFLSPLFGPVEKPLG